MLVKLTTVLGAAALSFFAVSRVSRYSLRGKVVLVTDGARGFGLVLAEKLAAKGAKLVLCARDRHALVEAHRGLEARGAEVLAVPCDVRDQRSVEQMIAAARATFGGVDVLINNGVTELATMRPVVDELRERRGGRIVNVTPRSSLANDLGRWIVVEDPMPTGNERLAERVIHAIERGRRPRALPNLFIRAAEPPGTRTAHERLHPA